MMKFTNMVSNFLLAGSLLCTAALAQAKICVGGDLDHLTIAQRSTCSAKAALVRHFVATLHAPDSWHFIVVCGEEGWKQYTSVASHPGTTLVSAAVDTDYTAHETFVREDRVDMALVPAGRNFLTEEIAGIILHESHATNAYTERLATASGTTQGQ